MKNAVSILCIVMLVTLLGGGNALAVFRCGSKIIDRNSTKEELLANCGEPTDKKSETREVKINNCESKAVHNPDATEKEKREDPCFRIIDVEEWFYNFGPSQYTYTIIFEDGKIVRIERGPHGF